MELNGDDFIKYQKMVDDWHLVVKFQNKYDTSLILIIEKYERYD